MAEITASMVKGLRDETGQGMMECKKALTETGGDVEAAKDLLRKKGLAMAEKKSARVTNEGLIAIEVADGGTSGAMVEVQCETDFCARNEVFQTMVKELAKIAVAADDGPIEANDAINERVQAALAKISENMSYSRGVKISAPKIATYLHHNGKVGVMLGAEGEIADETLSDLCMHIAFSDPMGVTTDDIPGEVIEKEKRFATEQAIESGKPPEIAEKMVVGKIRKFLESKALIEQPFVRDDKKKVKDILGGAKVTTFARFAVGE
jgi:elongation factor Ts